MIEGPTAARHAVLTALTILLLALPTPGRAQTAEARPSFSLASSHIFSTREACAISLTYRRVDYLDFRVYRVNDAFAFFEKLREPHVLGSEAPLVPQERTWLERIAIWKATRRADVRAFVRRQFSSEFRAARRNQEDARRVVQRRTVNASTFAQVPLLNASQLVTSWREILPPVADAEYRRVPLELASPGVYLVEAVNAPLRAYTIVIVSDVGLVTKTAPGQILVYAANRFTSDPLPQCRVRVLIDQKPVAGGTTSADGTYETRLAVERPDSIVTVAQCGTEFAATDPGAHSIRQPGRDLVGYIYTDRPVYRPGHVVHFKSVLRWRERGVLLPFDRTPVEIAVVDGNEKVLLRDRKTADEFGSITGSFTVPAAAALGYYSVRVTRGDQTASGTFEVQEYRKPEFDVAVRAASRFALQGSRITATIAARYYFGQPVAGGAVKYVVHRQPYYSPLRYEDGDESGEESPESSDAGWYGGEQQLEGSARLNDQGTAEVSIPLASEDHGRDFTARIEARVTDASGREVSGASSVVATYGRFMVIARASRYVVAPGEGVAVDLRAVDYQGNPRPGTPIHAVLERISYPNGYSSRVVTSVRESDVETGPDGHARSTVDLPPQPGSYRFRVSAPSEDRQVSDETYLWVPGSAQRYAQQSNQYLELVADRRTYQPGETAKLLVRGAEFDASVLVTKEHQQIAYHQVLHARGNEAIEIPIAEDDVGDTYVSVVFVKDDRLFLADRRLVVPATKRQLTLVATADRAVVRPGEPGTFTLQVNDASGAPIRAQLSLGLVDEAIYGVRPDTTPDPLRFFYRREFNAVGTHFSRNYPFVGYSGTEQLLLARRRHPMTLADFKTDRPERPRVRKDFPDTIFWAGDVVTGADGAAQARIDYPDSLTTWRLTVRAITVTTEVGTTTAHTTTTKDLILRLVTPRFLTEGDRVSIPTIVHNYLPGTKSVSVSLSSEGLAATHRLQGSAGLGVQGPAGLAEGQRTTTSPPAATESVQVPSGGQQRLDWGFAANQVRTVTLTGKATTDAEGDAMEISLPVLPAGLQRNAGSSGSIVEAGERTIELTIPPAANVSARSVRVSLAPSLAGTMLGALDYLTSYPWGCTEQTLSGFVPNLVVLRALSQLQLVRPERLSALDRQVSDGLKRLYDYQHKDGGWGWWKTDHNQPFMTAYALDGLIQARENGAKVDEWRISSAKEALIRLYAQYPRTIPDLKAYEVYVLMRTEAPSTDAAESSSDAGDSDGTFSAKAAIDDLWSARSRMTVSGQALLLMTLDQRRDARANGLAREIVSAAQTRGEIAWWSVTSDPLLEDVVDTSVEASALALKALSTRDPRNPLLERVARWLVLNRSAGGYWISTKQTALALQGLLAFMAARGEHPAPLDVDVYVNGSRINTTSFDVKSLSAPDPVQIEGPAQAGTNTVRIVKRGAGALYYDAAVRYYDQPAASERTGSRRLALTRTYGLLSPTQVKGRIVYRETPFTGSARPGDLILVRLTAAGSTDWRYLMLEDPIPAGTEPVEKETLYELEGRRSWRWGTQRELRDDRAVFFLSDFGVGRYELSYMLKVTTPGTFSATAAHIAPMYVPDVSASSDKLTLTVSSEASR